MQILEDLEGTESLERTESPNKEVHEELHLLAFLRQ